MKKRFIVLDSFKGIAAIFVVFYHLKFFNSITVIILVSYLT